MHAPCRYRATTVHKPPYFTPKKHLAFSLHLCYILLKKCSGVADMTIGQRIKAERERRRMRQEELAERVGISRQMLGHIECDRRRVSAEAAKGLAKVLRIPAKDIYLGAQPYGHWTRNSITGKGAE